MSVEELHSVLDDDSKKITVEEFIDMICELRLDVVEFAYVPRSEHRQYHLGQANAFQICLDLADHIEY